VRIYNSYQQGEEKDSDNENDRNNGLRMKKVMTMTEKRFSFFADPLKINTISLPTMAHLLLPRHTKPTLRQNQKSHFCYPLN